MKEKKREGTDRIETVATNRKARHDYEIISTHEAGLVLEGPEVKSLRQKQAVISQGFARFDGDALWLYGVQISPYAYNSLTELDQTRTRKLLMKSAELRKLRNSVQNKGFALIPLDLYFRNGWAKLLIGVCRGRKTHDKHELIKKRDIDREIRRDFKEKFKG
ncbi:MAG: SsrA-binding protein SmpB [Elusimicrobiales bacterium]|nr:SsrA-binding protein SmpB [Elusimicrobiales bacterium]